MKFASKSVTNFFRASIFSVTVLFMIAACTSVSTPIIKTGTTEQRYFAAKQDYATMLTAVERYVSACRKKPTKACLERSKKAQEVDSKLFVLFKAGDVALRTKEDTHLSGYLSAIVLGISELRAYSVEKID